MSSFGKMIAGILMGVSSLFGRHSVPLQAAVVISEPAAVVATTTVSRALPPVIANIIHTPSKSAAPSPAPVVTPNPIPVSVAPAKTYCPSGQEVQNGACQWTASSTAAINLTNEQLLKKEQDQIAEIARDKQQKIAALQDSYNYDVQSEQLLVLKAQCTDALYARTEALTDSSFGGLAPVAAGNKQRALAIAAAQDQANCGNLTASAEDDLQAVRADEASLKAQLSDLENQP